MIINNEIIQQQNPLLINDDKYYHLPGLPSNPGIPAKKESIQ